MHGLGISLEVFRYLPCTEQGTRRRQGTIHLSRSLKAQHFLWRPTFSQLNPTLNDQITKYLSAAFLHKYPIIYFNFPVKETILCSQIIDTFVSQSCLPSQLSFQILHKPPLPHALLPVAFPCFSLLLYPFISATCSSFPSNCISFFLLFHSLIKLYFSPSIFLP